ncbi:MAG: PAS domain S-box protein, partial [Myxococcales bacterium]|nr:PAS domain S-box protein [Myxococcales bacterium]
MFFVERSLDPRVACSTGDDLLPKRAGAGATTQQVNVNAAEQDHSTLAAMSRESLAVELARERARSERLERALHERDRQFERQRENLKLFREILDTSTAIIYAKDVDGRILYVNREYERSLGTSARDVIGQTDDAFMPAKIAAQHRANDLRVLEEGRALQWEEQAPMADGSIHTFISLKFPLTDVRGRPEIVCGISTDITQRKRAEQALRESEARLALVISETGVGLWDWQIKSGKRIYNARWAEMVGYSLDELVPDGGETWRRLVHADDLARSDQLLRQHFAGETAFYECEVRMMHKDGHWVWVSTRGKVVEWDAEDRPVRMVGTHFDITERKQIELEREQLIAQLQSSLDEVSTLQGILPICSYCKQIRSDEDYWQTVESYISARTGAEFSHSICPTCYEKHLAPHLENRRSRPTPRDTM